MKAKGKRQKEEFKNESRLVIVGLALAVVSMGCGYQFSGRGEGLPRDLRTVFVQSFVNKSRDVGVEAEIASALRSEFYRQGQLLVVNRVEEADAVLSGVIRSLDSRVVAVNRKDEALQFEMVLVVDMSLRRRTPDEILWRTQGNRIAEVYSGSRGVEVTTSSDFKNRPLNPVDLRQFTDIQLTESLKREAKDRLVQRLARELHQRLVEMF